MVGVSRRGSSIVLSDLYSMFMRFSDALKASFASAIVIGNLDDICEIEWDLCSFLTKLRIKRKSIIKFLLIYSQLRCKKVQRIILDSGFQLSLRDAERIIKALRLDVEIEVKSSIATPGLEVADFVADIAPYIDKHNIAIYKTSRTAIMRV